MPNVTDNRQLAGFFKQLGILFWKNWILFKRNKLGTFGEIMMAFLFAFIIVALRYLIDPAILNTQSLPTVPVIAPVNVSSGIILYYPNNNFIKDIVTNAVTMLNAVRRIKSNMTTGITGKKFNLSLVYKILFDY